MSCVLFRFQADVFITLLIRQVGDDELEHLVGGLHAAIAVAYQLGRAEWIVEVLTGVVVYAFSDDGAALGYLHHLFEGVEILPAKVPAGNGYEVYGVSVGLQRVCLECLAQQMHVGVDGEHRNIEWNCEVAADVLDAVRLNDEIGFYGCQAKCAELKFLHRPFGWRLSEEDVDIGAVHYLVFIGKTIVQVIEQEGALTGQEVASYAFGIFLAYGAGEVIDHRFLQYRVAAIIVGQAQFLEGL